MNNQQSNPLLDTLTGGTARLGAFFKNAFSQPRPLTVPADPGTMPNQVWTPPAGAGFAAQGYSLGPDGQYIRHMPDGSQVPFVPTQEQLQQLANAGMPNVAGEAQPAATIQVEQPGVGKKMANVLNSDNTKKAAGALAAVLAQQQANKPKVQQPAAVTTGSVLNPDVKGLDLFKANMPGRRS